MVQFLNYGAFLFNINIIVLSNCIMKMIVISAKRKTAEETKGDTPAEIKTDVNGRVR